MGQWPKSKQTRADQKHGREEARKSKGGCDRISEAREGYDRIMPKDMTDQPDVQVAAQRLVMKLPLKNAVRTSLCYVSRVLALCGTNVDQ